MLPVRHSRVTSPSSAVPPAAALAFFVGALAAFFTSVLLSCGMGTCNLHEAPGHAAALED